MMSKGIPLYGSHTKPPNFPDDWKPSVISVDELLQSSVWRRKSLMSSRNSQLDEAVQADLYEATMKEVDSGTSARAEVRLRLTSVWTSGCSIPDLHCIRALRTK